MIFIPFIIVHRGMASHQLRPPLVPNTQVYCVQPYRIQVRSFNKMWSVYQAAYAIAMHKFIFFVVYYCDCEDWRSTAHMLYICVVAGEACIICICTKYCIAEWVSANSVASDIESEWMARTVAGIWHSNGKYCLGNEQLSNSLGGCELQGWRLRRMKRINNNNTNTLYNNWLHGKVYRFTSWCN